MSASKLITVKEPQKCVDLINEAEGRLKKGALKNERVNLLMVLDWLSDHLAIGGYDIWWDGDYAKLEDYS